MNLIKTSVLIDKDTNTIYSIGDLLRITAGGVNYTGRLEGMNDIGLKIDASAQYDSIFRELFYSQITEIVKL